MAQKDEVIAAINELSRHVTRLVVLLEWWMSAEKVEMENVIREPMRDLYPSLASADRS
jgi:hypothetical protein